MSEKLPYGIQWEGLPLPDEDTAWQDMRRRLEEDRDDKLIPWWRRGCLPWGILLFLLLAIGWWIFKPGEWSSDRKDQEKTNGKGTAQVRQDKDSLRTNAANDTAKSLHDHSGKKGPSLEREFNADSTPVPRGKTRENVVLHNTTPSLRKKQAPAGERKGNNAANSKRKPFSQSAENRVANPPATNKGVNVRGEEEIEIINARRNSIVKTPVSVETGRESSKVVMVEVPGQHGDSLNITSTMHLEKKKDSLVILPPATEGKRESTKKRPLYFSAGLAMQQQLPIDSQTATPYNASGRKGTLRDYIPSVYFRLNKKDKWFIQFEFKYGAPQYTRPIQYYQKTVIDTGTNIRTTNSSLLRKTYYHQLPLTFHYHLIKNWTIGTGITWNRFSSAITEQSVVLRLPGTQTDTLVSQGVYAVRSDSAFSKSYFQAVFETQYQWKRFSLGARYAFGLQPYIKFTLPGGVRQEEKNSSLQIFLRYQLWKGREFTGEKK